MEEFKCQWCEKICKNLSSLHNHEMRCEQNPNRIRTDYTEFMKDKHKSKPKVTCEVCGKEISISNIAKHLEWHRNNPDLMSIKSHTNLNHDGLTCQYCGKVCKNRNSLAQHEIRCKENVNKLDNSSGGWNKGLTKKTSELVKKQADSLKTTYLNGYVSPCKGKPSTFKGKHHTVEVRSRLSEVAIERDSIKPWRHKISIFYNGVVLESRYELKVAEDLDANNIKWIRPKNMPYIDHKGITHHYFPDFYLPNYDLYLDPKNDYIMNDVPERLGYSHVQKIEWVCEQNNVRVLIVDKDHLSWEGIKELCKEKGWAIEK